MEDGADAQFIVKMSGMPFSASCEDVAKFLAGLDIKGGRKSGVHITKDDSGTWYSTSLRMTQVRGIPHH